MVNALDTRSNISLGRDQKAVRAAQYVRAVLSVRTKGRLEAALTMVRLKPDATSARPVRKDRPYVLTTASDLRS